MGGRGRRTRNEVLAVGREDGDLGVGLGTKADHRGEGRGIGLVGDGRGGGGPMDEVVGAGAEQT